MTGIQSRDSEEPPRGSQSDVEEQKENYTHPEMCPNCLQLNDAGEDQIHEDCHRFADAAESSLQKKSYHFERVAVKNQAPTDRQVGL